MSAPSNATKRNALALEAVYERLNAAADRDSGAPPPRAEIDAAFAERSPTERIEGAARALSTRAALERRSVLVRLLAGDEPVDVPLVYAELAAAIAARRIELSARDASRMLASAAATNVGALVRALVDVARRSDALDASTIADASIATARSHANARVGSHDALDALEAASRALGAPGLVGVGRTLGCAGSAFARAIVDANNATAWSWMMARDEVLSRACSTFLRTRAAAANDDDNAADIDREFRGALHTYAYVYAMACGRSSLTERARATTRAWHARLAREGIAHTFGCAYGDAFRACADDVRLDEFAKHVRALPATPDSATAPAWCTTIGFATLDAAMQVVPGHLARVIDRAHRAGASAAVDALIDATGAHDAWARALGAHDTSYTRVYHAAARGALLDAIASAWKLHALVALRARLECALAEPHSYEPVDLLHELVAASSPAPLAADRNAEWRRWAVALDVLEARTLATAPPRDGARARTLIVALARVHSAAVADFACALARRWPLDDPAAALVDLVATHTRPLVRTLLDAVADESARKRARHAQ